MDPSRPFNPARKRTQRARAAAGFAENAFLYARAAEELAMRLEPIQRAFPRALVLGGGGYVAKALAANPAAAGKIGLLLETDLSAHLAFPPFAAAVDPERLPFAAGAFDLVACLFGLQWVNDLPGALIQIRRALKPDGLFIGVQFGGATLSELRAALLEAEADLTGAAALRIAPMADTRDLGGLLQRAGFALPVADSDRFTVRYQNPLRLFADLRAMGETAAMSGAVAPLRRVVLAQALERLAARADDGRMAATFELIWLAGWAPHESQQKPLAPGSAKARLADALRTTEVSAGEKAGGEGALMPGDKARPPES